MNQNLDYRRVIQEHFKKASDKNPRFSLRAFSRRITISPAHLSRVLSGKRSLSLETAQQISESLKFNSKEAKHFLSLVEYANAEDTKKEIILQKIIKQNRRTSEKILDMEKFNIVSNWQHFAILNLFETKDFKCDVSWISRRLSIPHADVRIALDRLENVGLLVRSSDGVLKPAQNASYSATTDDINNLAIKEHHRQILKKGEEAISESDAHQREFQSLMIPMDPELLKKAKQKIRDFIDEMESEFGHQNAQEVFQLGVQLFPLSKSLKNKKDVL